MNEEKEKVDILSAITRRFVTSLHRFGYSDYEKCKAIASAIFYLCDEKEEEVYKMIDRIFDMLKKLIFIDKYLI